MGAPPPGLFAVTLYGTLTDWPSTDGSGTSDVTVVVVSALLTVCGVECEDALLLTFRALSYAAVSDSFPAKVNARSQGVSPPCPREPGRDDWEDHDTVRVPPICISRRNGARYADRDDVHSRDLSIYSS